MIVSGFQGTVHTVDNVPNEAILNEDLYKINKPRTSKGSLTCDMVLVTLYLIIDLDVSIKVLPLDVPSSVSFCRLITSGTIRKTVL